MSAYVETDHDRWAEMQARQCDKTADALEISVRGWLAKGESSYVLGSALVCAVKAETWREAAANLRRPAEIGRERAEMRG